MNDRIGTLKAIGSFLSGVAFLITAIFGIVKWSYERRQRVKVLSERVNDSSDMQWSFPDEKKYYY